MTLNCVGQSLFFDNLENSIWTSESFQTDSVIFNGKEIGLSKLRVSKDSIEIDRSIWTFKDDLTITQYSASSKKETLIGSFDYEVDKENGLLMIKFDEENPSKFHVGIISTGSFARLSKEKK